MFPASIFAADAANKTSGTFTAAAMNVDGMPNTITVNSIYKYSLNADGPGSEGTKAISQKMNSYGWDIIACSEDFNFNTELLSSMTSYSSGTLRGTIPTSWNIVNLPDWPLDTDGLNLLWKKDNVSVSGEKCIPWMTKYGTDINLVIAKIPAGNGADNMIDKGYRFYQATIDDIVVDVYILHMDADSASEDIAAREAEITQLANAIKSSDNKNPIIVMGDTNCRYTRENLETLFIDVINADSRFTIKDAWVEKVRNGIYPTYGTDSILAIDKGGTYEYPQAEIVDKMFYINNSDSNVTLTANSYEVVTDFTDTEGTALADHWPIVVDFTYEIEQKESEHTHSYTLSSQIAATCTESGNNTYSCSCGDFYTETIDVLGHDYQVSEFVQEDCTQGGKTVYTCSRCGDSYTETTSATGHSYVAVVTQPTCTENGYTTYTCEKCGDNYISDNVLATGHQYEKGVCKVCGEIDPEYSGESEKSGVYTLGNPATSIISGDKYVIVFPSGLKYSLNHNEEGVLSAEMFNVENGRDISSNVLWTFTVQDKGYTISTEINSTEKYLARTKSLTNGGYKIALQDTPFIWNVQMKTATSSARISTKVVSNSYCLRYYTRSTGWIVTSKGADVKIYEVNE